MWTQMMPKSMPQLKYTMLSYGRRWKTRRAQRHHEQWQRTIEHACANCTGEARSQVWSNAKKAIAYVQSNINNNKSNEEILAKNNWGSK